MFVVCHMCGAKLYNNIQIEYHNTYCFNSIGVKPVKPTKKI